LPLILFLLILEAFFSGSEMAIVACDKVAIRNRASQGVQGALLLDRMLKRPEWLLSTTMVGANLAAVANVILITFLLLERFPYRGEFYALLLIVPVIIFWGRILPKSIFQRQADILAPRVIHMIWLASYLFAPVLWVLSLVSRSFRGQQEQGETESDGSALERDDLRGLLRTPQDGSDIPAEERMMVDRLIDLSNKKVHEVMIPLIDVVALPETASWQDAVRLVVEKGHSRLPVFREKVLQIVGILHHFDLLLAPERSGEITPLVRPAFYVPETKRVYELLLFMKKSGNSMAIAVDEYGGAAGIITLEDILEEIVGDIEDEYDPRRFLYRKIGPSSYLVDARIEIDHLNERFSLALPDGDYETLGGFLMTKMGRILNEGEVVRLQNLVFTVEKATPRSVDTLRMDIF